MNESSSRGGLRRLVRPRLYQQLADHISDFIEAQGLVPGDRLPPERELAAELGVSRATLSRALVALEVSGRVEVRHGDGAVIQPLPQDSSELVRVLAHYDPDDLALVRSALVAGARAEGLTETGSALFADLDAALRAGLEASPGQDAV